MTVPQSWALLGGIFLALLWWAWALYVGVVHPIVRWWHRWQGRKAYKSESVVRQRLDAIARMRG